MTTMKAAVAHAFGARLCIEDVPMPVPREHQVLVQLVATGVCHTDLHAIDGDWPVKPTLPLIPGHEGVGYVVAVGAGVTQLREGDAVGIPWLHDACGECEYCETGWETLCAAQHNTGYGVQGTYAEYVVADARFVGRLPREADLPALAPILCAGVTSYKGLKETEARPGEWVAISGIGGLGHVAVQYARAMGLRVVALDVSPDKQALALELGADIAIDATQPHAAQRVVEATGGGAHGVLVTAVSPDAFAQAIDCVRPRGTVAFVGLPPGAFPTPIFPVVLKRITLRGSIVGTRRDLDEALSFAVSGRVRCQVEIAPLSAVNDVLARLRGGRVQGRVVLSIAEPTA